MATIEGFKHHARKSYTLRPVELRIADHLDVYQPLSVKEIRIQASRCMDCGTQFCSWGCPLGNLIPYWNEHAQNGDWEEAYRMLRLTNNFPEFTGKICPALCETSCSLSIHHGAVTIREIEHTIIETAFKEGWVKPRYPKMRTGKQIAIIGSGPAGLTVADELNAVGHEVTVYERSTEVGGLLRFGIPNFKLEKYVIDRRIELMKEAGVKFVTGVEVGTDMSVLKLEEEMDALVLTGGSTIPRDLQVKGRELKGIHYAVDYLSQYTMSVHGLEIEGEVISAKDKTVLVIGGGDTGSDCIGTAVRQGAKAVYQYEIMPKPPEKADVLMTWPTAANTLKTTSSHEEGAQRFWSTKTHEFIGSEGKLRGVVASSEDGSEYEIAVDLVFLAMGFLHPAREGMIEALSLELDQRGNVATDKKHMTSRKGIFSAGDMRSGQSLVVRAIHEGRIVARDIDEYLMGDSLLRG
ncbi:MULTISPECIES: glutamate synthase subunit beta [unclassified Fusibacter]|uniref:glutamate synthase subunit beta n=1 Tax=unclassified Fusibacter TaxID=2624464 RepID=UPI001011F041|nr:MULTISPECIES: glutamate synthase subunit beta [unclassified Fusibacter]MCK8059111.1 glutamate synthase subunit beta [Fusibacter sp. A2]NPE22520.1 glutamate synthase subunit beta [Fusibacter sp. A1]RXV60623.1 glutamate synthase subunit beta [Fusibacter sp. A1]